MYPEVGKPMMNIVFKNNNNRGTYDLESLRGHWAVLNFWSVGCIGCINTFPEDNELAKKFGDTVKYILIGEQDSENIVQAIFKNARKKYDLSSVQSFYDSTLFRYWDIHYVPVVVIVDPNGIVRYITTNVTPIDFSDILINKAPMLTSAIRNFGPNKLFYSNEDSNIWNSNNDASNTLYISKIAKYDTSFPVSFFYDIKHMLREKGYVQMTGFSLAYLYNTAYFGRPTPGLDSPALGKIYPFPIFKVKDSSSLILNFPSKGCYSLMISKPNDKIRDANSYQENMKLLLDSYFGFKSSIKTMNLPYYKLIVIDSNLLRKYKSKGGKKNISGSALKVTYSNVSLAVILRIHDRNFYMLPPFIDESNIHYNVDLAIEGILSDFEEYRKSLREHGLDLVLAHKIMKVVLVVSAN
jgi:hypothetical protein